MIGVYAGSFDPITNGHTWVIKRAAEAVGENGELHIAIANNSEKIRSQFNFDERKDLLEKVLSEDLPHSLWKRCEVIGIGEEYLVKFAETINAKFIFRGIRNVKDFDYELGIQSVNRDLCPDIETLFFIPPAHLVSVSSSVVKGMVGYKDWKKAVSRYVHPIVIDALDNKLKGN